MVAGINLDFNTGVFKPTYYGYDTPDEAIKAKGQKIQIAKKEIQDAARNKHAQMEKCSRTEVWSKSIGCDGRL